MIRMIAAASLSAGLLSGIAAAEAKGGNIFQSPCMSHFSGSGCGGARGNGTLRNGPNAAKNGQGSSGNAGAGGGVNPGAQ